MTVSPTVTTHWPQPITEVWNSPSSATASPTVVWKAPQPVSEVWPATPAHKPAYLPGQADYYWFYSPVHGKAVFVLRGDTAPTVTGGYAKVNVIDRHQRTGVTTFAGYDPITMDVPVRFEAYLGEKTGYDIEADIQAMEWLAGRGIDSANTWKDKTPPYVAISCYDAKGNTMFVLGNNYSFDDKVNPNVMRWWVTGIQWDSDGVLYNSRGRRVRQTATVQLTQYVELKGGKFGTPKPAKRRVKTHYSTARNNTMAELAKRWSNTKAEVRALNKGARQRPYVRDFSKKIPVGRAFKFYVK